MGRYAGYPAYKASGVAWLGEIPAHWEARRAKFVVTKIGSGKTPRGGSDVYVDDGIMLIRSQNVYDDGLRLDDVVYITEDADSLQSGSRVIPDDVLLNITGASIGRTSLVPNSFPGGNVNQHVCIFRPAHSRVLPEFLHYLLCSQLAKYQVFASESGTSREGLNFQQAGNLTFAFPPLPEQQAIARFLDHKTAQIDALIARKEALLARLADKRTALISQAVTKGLDPAAPMKDSGIDWLGEIPAHWEISRAKFVSSVFVPQRNKPELNQDEGVPWLTMEDMVGDCVSTTTYRVTEESAYKAGSRVLKAGAVVASCVGSFGVAAINGVDVIINQQLQAYVPFGISSEYLLEIVRISEPYFTQVATAATIRYVNQSYLGNMPIAIPPEIEQSEIIHFCQELNRRYKDISIRVGSCVDALKQYRTALITHAVTGKIDVRGVAL